MSYEKHEIYKNKSLSDIFKEVHSNSRNNKAIVLELVDTLKPLITDTGSAITILPLIKDCLDLKIKNDDMLIKMATVVQRLIAAEAKGDQEAWDISSMELDSLLEQSQDISKDISDKKDETDKDENLPEE